jgi:putative ABC transport system permease protein
VFLALAQIWANKTRSILTTIGIVIGVASVTAVIAALSGLKSKVLGDIESFGTNNIFMGPHKPDRGPMRHASDWQIRFKPEHFDGLLEHCPSVARFTRISWGGEPAARAGERSVKRVKVFGVEPAWHQIENRPVVLGRSFSPIDEMQGLPVCIIDTSLRDELRLDRDCIGDTLYMDGKGFRIVGVIEPKQETSIINEGQTPPEAYIPFATNLKMRQPWIWAVAAGRTTSVAEEAQAEITFFLRRQRRIRPEDPNTFRVISVASEIKKFNQIARMITIVAGGIVGISLLVGGVGIMNIMLVSVSERTREIGLRKAVGAKNSAILLQFMVESVVLCFIGGLVGVGGGRVLTLLISMANPMLDKTYIPMWAIGLSFCFAAAVGVFFGMFPAIKAASLDPIEALRHE